MQPQITETDIRNRVGETSFKRASPYVPGSIISPRRQGNTLKAFCQGSSPQPYRVEVTVEGGSAIVAGECNCPVGAGGFCKHVAALLLTWLKIPGAFLEVAATDTLLQQRSKEELIALIHKMIARYPDLETLLEMPLPSSLAQQQQELDPRTIQRQVDRAIVLAGDEWQASSHVAQLLEDVLELGEHYIAARDWYNAATLHQTLAEALLDASDLIQMDEDGELHAIVNTCADRLGECLAEQNDFSEREELLRALFAIYTWDVNYGGIGIGDDVPDIICTHATQEEKHLLVQWVQAEIPHGQEWGDTFTRQTLGSFMLQLQEETLDDEGFLQICRSTGRLQDLVQRLLHLKRVDEAVVEAQRRSSDFELLTLADCFVASGYADRAEHLIRQRIQGTGKPVDRRLTTWLKERLKQRGDTTGALTLAEPLFWENPHLQGYQEIRALAQQAGQWEHQRPAILKRLHDEQHRALLIRIHLDEGEVAQALQRFKQQPQQRLRSSSFDATLEVELARMAEAEHPHEAIAIYRDKVNRLIAAQGRDNYITAASYLKRLRQLSQRLGEEEQWQNLIDTIRSEYRRLRALQDELNKAGL
jgi:uncharacterized Zn finger protein